MSSSPRRVRPSLPFACATTESAARAPTSAGKGRPPGRQASQRSHIDSGIDCDRQRIELAAVNRAALQCARDFIDVDSRDEKRRSRASRGTADNLVSGVRPRASMARATARAWWLGMPAADSHRFALRALLRPGRAVGGGLVSGRNRLAGEGNFGRGDRI